MKPSTPPSGSAFGSAHPVLVAPPPGRIEVGLAIEAAEAGAAGLIDLTTASDAERDAALAAIRDTDRAPGVLGVRVRADDGPSLAHVLRAVRFGPVRLVVLVGPPQSDEVAELGFAGAHVLAELTGKHEAPVAAAAGVQALVLRVPETVTAPDERLRIAARTAREIRDAVRLPVFVQGPVGPATTATLRDAGASGFVLDAQAWMTAAASPGGARELVTSHPDHLHAIACAERYVGLSALIAGIHTDRPAQTHTPRTEESPMSNVTSRSGNGQHANATTTPIDLAEGIAVIGMGCVLPQANDVDRFWENVKNGTDCIIEVPKDRWDPAMFYDPQGNGDTSYTKIGGFITDFRFDPIAFRIPPKTASALDPVQQMTLTAVREAFVRSGYLDEKLKERKAFDRERTAVILGNSMGGEIQRDYSRRIVLPRILADLGASEEVRRMSPAERDAFLQRFADGWVKHWPEVTEDSMPGELSNVVAGRVANVFDLKGKNHTADAACASSFAALDAAVKGLVERDFDLVVCGGADRSMDIDTYVKFCKIGALSANGSTPFDARADGFVMGEGVAVFLLKRLSDAVRDGDHVHAVIRGVGASSDGKGKGITAPNQRGQVLAVKRGLAAGGYAPETIQYLEAHGTSTKVGDVVELESLAEALALPPTAPKIAVGSVKSQIGHLKSAAGAAALLKTVLALENATIPPSINFQTPNPNIDWSRIPFRVPTQAEPWPANMKGLPRRAGISSFGFGGTNFHVVLEAFVPEIHAGRPVAAVRPAVRDPAGHYLPSATPAVSTDDRPIEAILAARAELEGETLVLGAADEAQLVRRLHEVAERFPVDSAFATTGQGPRLKDLVYAYNREGVKADVRVALVCKDPQTVRDQAKFALSCLDDPARMKIAPVKGVFAGKGAPRGKIAFLFPGQGSQYAEMLLDLYQKYAIVRDTFHEADDIMQPLIGQRLTPIIFPAYDSADAAARKTAIDQAEEALRQTEICQPAVLTADIALWRLLRSLGIEPDRVAGHSLGEYAALVAAGILRFEDALLAVSARGKEMAHVNVPDLGKMASITAPFELVEEVLAECQDYVIPANKNCPAMTVIAGSSAGVDEAVSKFSARGIQAQYIPVSAAFHSAIVAPASGPLRNVLSRLSIRPPTTPIYANVTGRPYETHLQGPAFKEYVLDVLAKQVASPVEWTETIRNMYADGVRTFIEVGPKRALAGFVSNILEGQDHIAVATNHPKKGGVYHINETYAVLAAIGHMPKVKHPEAVAHYTAEHLHPLGLRAAPVPTAIEAKVVERTVVQSDPLADAIATDELRALARDHAFVNYAKQQAPVVAAMLKAGYALAPRTPTTPYLHAPAASTTTPTNGTTPGFHYSTEDIVISGASIGLPGRAHRLFDDVNIDRILNGENCIDILTEDERRAMTDKNIVRLTKGTSGEAGFEAIRDTSQVIKLAAKIGEFDLTREFGIDRDFAEVLDITSKMAIGAAIDALRDAGIPLVREYQRTTTGSYLPKDWTLPSKMQDETGIIFASAFPGYDALLDEVSKHIAHKAAGRTREELDGMMAELANVVSDPTMRDRVQQWIRNHIGQVDAADAESLYAFNRKFLFYVLSMGHAQLAQLIKARGPNVQVNAACSSTTEAVAIAEDWIRTGRCRRVIVVGADAATSDRMFEWIGSGFLVSGAATTKEDVREAALPFDRRRHGMIIGSGAVGLVIEAREEARKRGMDGLVKILATQVANSAFHGSRLDVQHIADQMDRLVQIAEERYGFDRQSAAKELVFMSHETYTPARGGSASAEIESLRRTFGSQADAVIVANTKGFTGHPMGAGIEDAIAVKALQLGRVPPVANLAERDPELGDLNLSKGGPTDARYTLRLAAGFGSQIAFWLGERLVKGTDRVQDAARHQAWLEEVAGRPAPRLEVVNRTLRIVDAGAPARAAAPAPVKEITPAAAPEIAPPAPVAPAPTTHITVKATATVNTPDRATILAAITQLVVDQTGYPIEMLEPDLDLEADLGIDTVKQAELFGIIRSKYAVAQEEGLQIKDYPTLGHIADYIAKRVGGATAAAPATPAPAPVQPPAAVTTSAASTPAPAPVPATATQTATAGSSAADRDEILAKITDILVEQTGYPADMLEPGLDLEADLGIDTVKQAELFGIIRSTYAIAQEEGLQIKDYPTLDHIADYIVSRLGAARPASPPPVAATPTPVQMKLTASPPPATKTVTPSRPELDDGAPAFGAPAPAAPVPPAPQAATKTADPFALDDGAPSVDRPAAPARAATTPPPARLAAPQADLLDDGAPVFAAPAAPIPAKAPTPIPAPTPVATPPPAPTLAPTRSEPPRSATVSEEEVLAKVTALIADKTGYPADMLEPDLDLEADLGIDTVKQAEVFGEVRALFALPLPEGLKIADYPTVRHVAGFVLEQQQATTSPPAPAKADPPMPDAPSAPTIEPERVPPTTAETSVARAPSRSSAIRRLVVVPRDEPIGAKTRDPMVSGPILITQDSLGWADEFAALIAAAGHQVVLLGEKEPPATVPGHFITTRLEDVASIEAAVQTVRDRLGSIGGIIHLAALMDAPENETAAAFKAHTRRTVRSLYALARAARTDLVAKKGAPIVTVTRMGGTFGLTEADAERSAAAVFPAHHAGASGLTKALAKEFPDAYVRSVDLGLEFGPQDAARRAWSEITHLTHRVEVGHPELHRRVVIDVVPRPTVRTVLHPVFADDHLVVSGGAQGITAEALVALLRRVGPENAPALTLLGRTPLPANIAELAALDQNGLASRKKALLETLRAQNERVTPVMLEREWSKTTKAIEVHANIARMEALGARVGYAAVDVQDEPSVQQALAAARQAFGPVTGILHAAGLEISKLIADKDAAQYDAVYDVKTVGLHNLLGATRGDPLRQICVFASVAGRFGNLGQVDYSAANDHAVHLAIAEGARRGCRGFGIDWSAWAEVGMATRGGIMTVMEQSGVTPIPVAEGTRLFVEEWLTGDVHPEVVVAGALGAIDADGQLSEIPLPAEAPVLARGRDNGAPLVDAVIAHEPGRRVVAVRRLALDKDLYLADHRVDGVPYLPGVFGVELFAESAEWLLTPSERAAGFTCTGAEDVVFRSPVKLLRDRPLDVRVVVERRDLPVEAPAQAAPLIVAEDDDDAELYDGHGSTATIAPAATSEPVRFTCRLESDFVNEQGQVLGEVRVHFEGAVVFGIPAAPPVRAGALPARPDDPAALYARDDIYDHFFHGPTFQVLDAVSRIEGAHVAAIARFAHDGLFAEGSRPDFRTAPLAREAAFQSVGFWALVERGRMSLPASIRRIVHYGQPDDAPPGTSLVVLGRFEHDLPDGLHAEYTVEVYTPEGVLVDRMEGYRMIKTGDHQVARRGGPQTGDAHAMRIAPAQRGTASGSGRTIELAEKTEGDWELTVREPADGRSADAVDAARVGDLPVAHVDVAEVALRLDDPVYRVRTFTETELARIDALAVAKRRDEHAAGIVAAKEAIRRGLSAVGIEVTPDRLEVTPDPGSRAPVWRLVGHAGRLPALHLSVSHSNGHAVAAVLPSDEAVGVGIDVEIVAARAAGFAETAFVPEERRLAETLAAERGWSVDEVVTRFWCVKEATLKGLRTGLALDLRDVRVTGLLADGQAEVRMIGEAARQAAALGGGRIIARSGRFAPGIVGASARLVR